MQSLIFQPKTLPGVGRIYYKPVKMLKKSPGNRLKGILFPGLLCLILGHLVIQAYFPNLVINAVGLLVLFFIIFNSSILKKNIFALILIIYMCSHFNYANAQGGTFNLLAFLLIVFYYLVHHGRNEIRIPDNFMKILLMIFITSNIFGWLFKNPMPMFPRLLGIISFFGYLFMFNLTARINMTPQRLRLFLQVAIFMVGYSAAVALNNYFSIFKSGSPMIAAEIRFGSTTVSSMLGSSELTGEYGILTLIILIPFLLSGIIRRQMQVPMKWILTGILGSLLLIILSRSRSVFILFILLMVFVFFFFNTLRVRSINRKSYLLIYIALFVFILLIVGASINLDYIFKRMALLNYDEITIEGIISGEQINREYAFSFALERLKSDSWFLGYGWGTEESNRAAWFIDPDVRRRDYHSLYLSLPMIYGWFGSAAFLLIIITTVLRIFNTLVKYKQAIHYLIPALSFFFLLFIFFLINEYKISMLRLPQYHMVFWIWLGLAHSVINTIKQQKYIKEKK